MKKITMRLIALALLTLVSMGAAAKIDVQIANDGKFDGGTIEVTSQEEQKDGGVKVTITVSPNSGYTIKKEAIKVYATYPPSGSRADTRDIEIASNLTLLYNGSEKEDVKDASAKRDYTFIVPSGFGAWVKDAKFSSGSKGDRSTDGYSGVYYIGTAGYNANSPANNYYLCPTEGWIYYKPDDKWSDDGTAYPNPFLTTYICKTNNYHSGNPNDAIWYVEKHPTLNYYYIKHASDGKYVISNGKIDGTSNANRMRVHLEAVLPENLDDKALFSIYSYSDYLVISPKSPAGWNGDYKWYTVNNGNKNYLVGNGSNGGPSNYTATGGIIGTYTENDANAKFYLEKALSIDAPTITNNDGTFTISADGGATVYYTIDGTEPTTSSSTYSAPITQKESLTVIKAIAKATSDPFPTNVTTYYLPVCERPVISVSGSTVTITCTTEGATIHYTTDGSPATSTSTSTVYTGPFAKGDASTFRAIATKPGYVTSSEASLQPPTEVSSSDEMTDMSGNYILASNFTSASSIGTLENPFSGTIDGNMMTLSGLNHPLVAYANGATIKNVMLKDVQISGSGNVGAIAGEASGYTRIYNCGILPSNNKYENESSYVSSSDGNCGGLVGLLNDDSRVINCFSYANITGGTTVAGIVGYNDFASTAEESDGKYAKLKTAVVNCMFYGNITSGTTRYPVYGGEKILNNTATGINNYDFYRAEANLGLSDNSHYNCSWPAQEEYLTKYEYYRYLLNSNRELCGWWVGAPSAPSGMPIADVQAVAKDASLMAKWVLDPSIAPYPILKAPGKYYSAINQDPDNRINPVSKTWESRSTSSNTITTKAVPDTEGQKLGSIIVTINKGGSLGGSDSKVIPITAMDIENNDFCYGKIQLPYYNSIFGDPNSSDWTTRYGGNYGDKVVVGWEITSVKGGTEGTLVKDWQTGYNFADRDCTNKDKERVFAQGGYYYVPNGVTEITITAKWADATYLDNNDNYYDRISVSSVSSGTANATLSPFAPAGTRSTTLGNGKTVKTGAILSNLLSGSVYEKAIVLVGNNQNFTGNKSYGGSSNGFTVMSADFDLDEEPDYSLIWQLGNQTSRYSICPIRFDFLPVIEMGMAMKEDGSTQYYSLGCYRPLGHFEVTETSLIHFGQFEYGNKDRSSEAPLILNGGIFDQYTKGTLGSNTADDKINYIIIGGNVRIPSFTPGAHPSDREQAIKPTRHCSLNVMGGNIDYLYLTGNYNEAITPNQDNPHCYIDGGYLKQVAAAGKEGVDGDVFFKINHSVIEEFYGGSTMDQSTGDNFKTVKGDINVTVDNSKITKYCGGPKFGNMASGKTVTTNATGTTFGVYYGGGNGGTSYVQYAKTDITEANAQNPYDWNGGSKGNLNSYTPTNYRSTGKNYMADYEMEIVNSSAGTDANKGIFRTYFYAAQFSATNTGPITNNLTDCKVLTSFYGGGNLGGVIGDVTSTLTDTEVLGSAFGAGYSASVPEVTIYNKDKTAPTLNVYTGIITPTPDPDTQSTHETYTWCYKNKTTNVVIPSGVVIPAGVGTGNPTFEYGGKKYFYTEESLENLGTVKGKVTLKIEGTTTVKHSAYGGGEESGVDGNTEVKVTGGTIGTSGKGGAEYGNVFGGGKGKADDVNAGLVKGNTTINISQAENQTTTIIHNVYGGGAFGSVGTFTYDGTTGLPNGLTENTGTANITITGGTFGSDGKENGMIFGSSRGSEGDPTADTNIDKIAWVGNTNVIIGTSAAESNANPWIKGSVYGGGENGHNYQNGHVTVHSGTIGITDSSVDGGARYSTRGNVYGGGCGTDTFDRGEGDNKKTYYDFNAGIVMGNTQIDIDGGHIVHNVYGGGAMGSVGTYTLADAAYNAEHPEVPVGMPISCAANTGTCTINITGGLFGMTNATMTGHGNDGPDDFGHVFGAGRGYSKDPNVYPNIESCAFFNNTYLTIGGTALVCGSVYGGSESGHVLNNADVTISGGQIGCGVGRTTAYTDDDFNTTSLPGTAHWTNDANGAPYDQYASPTGTYDYTDFPKIPAEDRKETSEGGRPVATDGRTFYGNVFAGGSGYYPYAPGFWLKSAGHIGGTATVTVSGGHILNNLYGGCEMADIDGAVTVTMTGGTVGVPRTKEEITANPNYGNVYGAGMGDKRIFFNTSTNVASATVNISNGTIYGSVFGGGEDGHVLGNATTTISQPAEKTTVIGCDGLSGNDGNVFGAGQGHTGVLTAGVVGGNASLTVTGGTMKGSVYGGGRIASVGTYFAMADDPNYGQMQDGDDHGCLTVSLTGGTIEQNVYGGGMGTTTNVLYGESKNVLVELNKDKTATDKGCIVKGDIFGCNNVNGTPKGDVMVHVYATQNAAATQIANASEVTTAKVKGRYDVTAVYGGGNMAAYDPVTPHDGTSGSKTKVIIEGCSLTSIETVYGGGNAAAVPETDVVIKSAYEIGYLFGGGNGKDDIAPGVPNPGADVGTLDHGTSTYGTGNANTLMEGGLIHEAYGGSNTKGIIKGSINQITDPKDPAVCELAVEKIVGAGKYADVDGDVNMTLSCQPERKVTLLFAGADEANVNGNITLNVTNGHFGKVFGGNNLGGVVKGKITVNVEETGCQPIKIDDLYLGGNEAAYSVFGYYESADIHPVTGKKILKPRTSADDTHTPVANPATDATHSFPYAQPELNIISCTYIGNVFGGGFGEGAVMYANPTVNVNMVKGAFGDDEDKGVPKVMEGLGLAASENPDKLGIIENVYGGGDAANIEGNTTVNIATETGKGAYIIGNVFGGGNGVMDNLDLGKIIGNTHVIIGDGTDNANLHIKCSAYGGGNIGMVTGNTVVDVNNGIIGTNQKGGYKWGNVYGGGKGKIVETEGQSAQLVMNSIADVDAGLVKGNTTITINGTATTTQILHNVYGGGAVGSVGTFTRDETTGLPTACADNTGLTTVTINGGTIGHDRKDTGMVNGSSRGWEGNPEGSYLNQLAWVNNTNVIIGDASSDAGPSILGSVYGGGENGHNFKNGVVTVNKGTIGYEEGTWDCGNIYGAGCGTDTYTIGESTTEHHNPMAGCVRGTTSITVNGGNILRNVYGGGSMGSVGGGTTADAGKTTIAINGGTIGETNTDYGHVFGGPKGNLSETEFSASVWETQVNINTGADIKGSVFGGGEAGIVKGSVVVNMKGGEVAKDVYGGGALASTNTESGATVVNLTGGHIKSDVYGGGLGQIEVKEDDVIKKPGIAATVGTTTVNLNENVDDGSKGCVVEENIFGCNNQNGTPLGDVTVHIYKTQRNGATRITNTDTDKTAKVKGTKTNGEYDPSSFDIKAVYGGGNLSAYEPTDLENSKANVIIDGCERTSICQVYGGGNAASTPASNVTVNGTFEIGELFGGGNGLDDILINGVTMPNPGANVGYKDYSEYYKDGETWKVRDKEDADTKEKRTGSSYVYGTGKASVNIFGGTIHRVFGGSNTKGNVRQTAVTLLDEAGGCEFCVDEAYGGGKSAEMDAEAQLLMACIPGLQAVYGGAEAADVRGNVTLNITNGTFDRVFGGNNVSGTISGAITINVEEIGCKPVKIGQLYGGGNLAGYSVYGYDSGGQPKETGDRLYDDPQINVMSFTSIGNIYGGGYGNTAVMVGNPTVNVNEVYGKYYNDDVSVVGENAKTPNGYPIPSHAKGKMGAISEIFGGGNAAKVIGNTTVNIGTQSEVYVVKQVTSGATLPDGCYTRNDDGTYDSATGTASADITYYEKKDVLGADIRGNVYGGGNEAEVTGNTEVVIGQRKE